MPQADRMLNTLRRATDLVQATPGRQGQLVRLQNCTEVLVAGDLHGHVPNFQTIMIAADLANHPQRHLVLQELIHSAYRYENGGDRSHRLVDLFAALRCQFPNQVHYLPGNHELSQWSRRAIGKGDDEYNAIFIKGVEAAYGVDYPEIIQAYMKLFTSLPVALRTPNRVFLSHSLPNANQLREFNPDRLTAESFGDEDYAPGGVVYSLVWGRDTTQANVEAFLAKVDADWLVSGHIASEQGYMIPNDRQVIVDSCDYPASYILFPADRPITHEELVAGLVMM